MLEIFWWKYNNTSEQWENGGTLNTPIYSTQIAEYSISPITSLDDNFNIREPRTADITLAYDEDNTDDVVNTLITDLLEAEEFKKNTKYEVDETFTIDREDRIDCIRIKVGIKSIIDNDNEEFIYVGFVDKSSININKKNSVLSFSLIDALYLYKIVLEDARVPVYSAKNSNEEEIFLSGNQLLRMLLDSSTYGVWFGGERRGFLYEEGLDDTLLIDVSKIRQEYNCDWTSSSQTLFKFPVKDFEFKRYAHNLKVDSANVSWKDKARFGYNEIGLWMKMVFFDYQIESPYLFTEDRTFQTLLNKIRDAYSIDYVYDDRFYEIKVEFSYGFRASANSGFKYVDEESLVNDNYWRDGIYFIVIKHTYIRCSYYGEKGKAYYTSWFLSTLCQEIAEYKIYDKILTEKRDYKVIITNSPNGNIESHSRYGDPIEGVVLPEFVDLEDTITTIRGDYDNLKTTITNEDTSEEYTVTKQETGIDINLQKDHFGVAINKLKQNIDFILRYSGGVKIDTFNFGAESDDFTITANQLLKFMMFITGAYIYCVKGTGSGNSKPIIRFNHRFHTLISFDNVIDLENAVDDDMITEDITNKQYHEPFDSQSILEILLETTYSLQKVYNQMYELVFARNIVQKRLTIHNGAYYYEGEVLKNVNKEIELESLIKYEDKYWRVMSIDFPQDDVREYTLWAIGKTHTPTFSYPTDVEYTEPIDVEIFCKTYDSTIYYTVDGTDPALDDEGNPTGTTIEYTEAISVTTDTTIKAKAYTDFYEDSFIATAIYEVDFS